MSCIYCWITNEVSLDYRECIFKTTQRLISPK